MKILKISISFLLVFTLITCDKKSDPPAPEAAVLVAPIKDEVCLSGKVISDSESTVEFKWSTAANAESYELSVKNLLTNAISTQITNNTGVELALKRNTPYSWFVSSKSSKNATIALSQTWKFYNAGKGATSYPPFPAEIISPTLGQKASPNNGKISLQWRGSDSDSDIVNYDIYLGITNKPEILKSKVTETSLSEVSVNPAITYFWKVITRDASGNTSDSGIYWFIVN